LRVFISHPFIPCLLCITTTGVPTILLHPLMRITAGRTRAPAPPNQPSTPVYSLIRCPGKAHPSRTINAHQPDVCDPSIMPSVESRTTFHYNACRPSFDKPSNATICMRVAALSLSPASVHHLVQPVSHNDLS
jgi:hypothetical protein